ncbi:hypothetical protein GEMRC1_011460 [Eukaryota sp. GEM-RC1]
MILDPYSRPSDKKGGAWMDSGVAKSTISGQNRLPLTYVVTNCTPPIKGQNIPSLMTFGEVTTLFHEVGHFLQDSLTHEGIPAVSGTHGIEWDTIELASQFMENFCYNASTLRGFAKHYETKEPLPLETIENLKKLKTFFSGTFNIRQLLFGFTDMYLHSKYLYQPEFAENAHQVYHNTADKCTILKPLPEDRFLNGFRHIFAGGYAAGYFSYKFAECLSCDCWAAFEEVGLENSTEVRELGKKYRNTILAMGGGVHPMEVFRMFRGRDFDPKYLLIAEGLMNE